MSSGRKASTRRSDEDFADEIRAHLEFEAEQLVADGVAPREAQALARRLFGNVTHVQEQYHESRRTRFFEELAQDLGYAFRQLRRSWLLFTVVVLTLALGVGANAVIFGVVDKLLLQPPPGVVEASRLRRLYFRGQSPVGPLGLAVYTTPTTPFAVTMALRSAPALVAVAGFWHRTFTLGRGADAERIDGEEVTGNYFELLGVRPEIGRLLTSADGTLPAGAHVVVLSHRFWMRQFGGADDVTGKALRIDNVVLTIVGVAARDFNGLDLDKVDVWMPIGAQDRGDRDWVTSPNSTWIRTVARLSPAATDATASRDATVVYRRLLRDWLSKGFENAADTLSTVVTASIIGGRGPDAPKEARISVWLAGVAGIVLLIVCANVANLLLTRAFSRRREIAVRLALGVARGRLVRQLLHETLLLAALASVVTIGVAVLGAKLVGVFLLPSVASGSALPDSRATAFAVILCLIATLVSGAAPALHATRLDIAGWLTTGARESVHRSRVQLALLIAQASLSALLLIGAGLFVRSLYRVRTTDVGVDLAQVLLIQSAFPMFDADTSRINAIVAREFETVRRVRGVTGVTLATRSAPKAGAMLMPIEVAGRASLPALETPAPFVTVIDSEYFRTLGARIIRGRGIQSEDERGPGHVAVINEMLAQRYWPNQSPLGACLVLPTSYKGCTEVVGVVQNILGWGLVEEARSQFYLPRHVTSQYDGAAILARTNGDARAVALSVRRALQSITPDMPYVDVRSYEELIEPDLRPWRLGATLFGVFGALALVISAIGLYGVLTYTVSQRTREIGVRMALGASHLSVVSKITREGVGVVGSGIVIGVALLLVLAKFVAPLLYRTSPTDPQIVAGVAGVLLFVAILASVAPARRAARVDPNVALREE